MYEHQKQQSVIKLFTAKTIAKIKTSTFHIETNNQSAWYNEEPNSYYIHNGCFKKNINRRYLLSFLLIPKCWFYAAISGAVGFT